ncbi:peptidoglycan DD-metalloendopeptidase family protein [bacterium]|nr:peptidoglycan DD-metalloendopeptidase family protein [bacterium]
MPKRIIISVIILFLTLPLTAQNKLSSIRNEIKELEQQILDQSRREKSTLETLQGLERELGLRKRLANELKIEQRRIIRHIKTTRTQLTKTEQAFNNRKGVISDRIISLYKRGRLSNWEALLSLNSLHQLSVWIKYQQRILDHDKRNLLILKSQRDSIQTQQQRLLRARNRQQRLITEAATESDRIATKKTQHQNLLTRVQQDSKSLQNRLRQKLAAFEEIKRMIARQQRQKSRGREIPSTQFASKKGRLSWPVKGRIVAHFGINRDPITRGEYDNFGIDIKAGDNDLVRSVTGGVVKVVTWQRSMGNIVMVDHGDNFITVYGHLEQVLVDEEDILESKDIIGRVGISSSLSGSILHFQVWKGEQEYNPESWLKKSGGS